MIVRTESVILMGEIDKIFFELIRVSIGMQDNISRIPSEHEWGKLYKMAEKQSLGGVCFAGLQRLGADADEGFTRIGMSEKLYLTWLGMAVQIQQRNEVVNKQCIELQTRLSAEGFKSCVLKGQGVGQLYAEHIYGLRQCGDIDLLMWKDGMSEKENRGAIVEYAKGLDSKAKASEHHIAVKLYDDTEVEMHYAPAYLNNPFANRLLKKWCVDHCEAVDTGRGFSVPTVEYDVIFMLAHAFRHYLSEGVGMRQMMDYYFVLRTLGVRGQRLEIKELLNAMNMLKFAAGVMWVMNEVFGLTEQFMICEPNERLGRKLLAHIMEGGNFGHHNNNRIASRNTHFGRFVNQVVRDLNLACDYSAEALWAPLSMVREFVRIRL